MKSDLKTDDRQLAKKSQVLFSLGMGSSCDLSLEITKNIQTHFADKHDRLGHSPRTLVVVVFRRAHSWVPGMQK